RVWYPVKALHIRYNLFAGTEKHYVSPFTSQSQNIFCMGDRPPIWEEGVELGGRVRYIVKAHQTGHNLLIETTCYLSLFRSHKPCKFCNGDRPPNWGKEWGKWSKIVPFE